MRPLTMLIGIVMGSSFSIAIALALTWVVFLFLPEHSARLAPERAPLARALLLMSALAAAAGASFYGELRLRRWRPVAHLLLLIALAAVTSVYWPRS